MPQDSPAREVSPENTHRLNSPNNMHHSWIAFATTGNPGWSPYNTPQRSTMRIDTTWRTVSDARPLEREAWEGVR